MRMPLRLELFGNLRLTGGEAALPSLNTNRLQSLLAFLALHRDAPQPRERLAFLLWPESSESQARTNLRQLIHHLRRALPAACEIISSDNQTLQWTAGAACSIDTAEFEAALAAARNGDGPSERQALEAAAALYQDDLLRGLYDDWLTAHRDQFREQLSCALLRLAAILEESGDLAEAIRYADRLVAHDPLREPHYQLLMRLHARNRDRASALRAYHQCMRVLRRELGVEPGVATRALFEQTLKETAPEPARVAPLPSKTASQFPLIGRAVELERLKQCWELSQTESSQLAILSGEPGIGKSRLAEELHQLLTHDGALAARARCYAAQGQLAYAPIAEWLRADPLRSLRSRLSKPQLSELSRLLPEILLEHADIPAPQPMTESWQRRHFFEALNAVFELAPGPLLLVIDDLQWCDRDSFEWLHSFFRALASRHVLVLGTVRPEEIGRDHALVALLRELRQGNRLTELALSPLTESDTRRLAVQIAGRAFQSPDWSDLHSTTQGNPLFVVETVRARIEDPSAKAAPPRIHAVITARLAQLSPPAHELAGLAATLGTSFSFDLLAKATDWDEPSLAAALEQLWERKIVGSNASGDYDFTHDRLREVAYADLSPVRRRFFHRRIARALEELHAQALDGISGQLAVHYEAAGMPDRAIRQYQHAARVAQRRYADTEAAALIRRALALAADLPENAARDEQELLLLATLGRSLVTTEGYAAGEVGETYSRALTLANRLGETEQLFSVLAGCWVYHIVRGDLEQSRRLAQQMLDAALAAAAPPLVMAANFVLGSSLFHLGRLDESLRHLEESLAAGDCSHPALALFAGSDPAVFCRSYLSHVSWLLGDSPRALEFSADAIAMAENSVHPFGQAIALNYAAMLRVFARESGPALKFAEAAAAVCRRHGFVYYLAMAEILAGWATAREGGIPAGLSRFKKGLDALRATNAELRLPFYHGLLAEIYALAGQPGEAAANTANALAFQLKNSELWTQVGPSRERSFRAAQNASRTPQAPI